MQAWLDSIKWKKSIKTKVKIVTLTYTLKLSLVISKPDTGTFQN